jgi:hypothetical protein
MTAITLSLTPTLTIRRYPDGALDILTHDADGEDGLCLLAPEAVALAECFFADPSGTPAHQTNARLRAALHFYLTRMAALQAWQATLPEPHRTTLCNILANGKPTADAPTGLSQKLLARVEALLRAPEK